MISFETPNIQKVTSQATRKIKNLKEDMARKVIEKYACVELWYRNFGSSFTDREFFCILPRQQHSAPRDHLVPAKEPQQQLKSTAIEPWPAR